MIVRDIEGKAREFVFGTLTFKILKDVAGIKSINEVFERLANKRMKKHAIDGDVFENDPISDDIDHQEFIVEFLFACAKTACDLKQEAVDFSVSRVYGWFDEMGVSSSMSLIQDLTKMYTEKNQPAPVAGQDKEAA